MNNNSDYIISFDFQGNIEFILYGSISFLSNKIALKLHSNNVIDIKTTLFEELIENETHNILCKSSENTIVLWRKITQSFIIIHINDKNKAEDLFKHFNQQLFCDDTFFEKYAGIEFVQKYQKLQKLSSDVDNSFNIIINCQINESEKLSSTRINLSDVKSSELNCVTSESNSNDSDKNITEIPQHQCVSEIKFYRNSTFQTEKTENETENDDYEEEGVNQCDSNNSKGKLSFTEELMKTVERSRMMTKQETENDNVENEDKSQNISSSPPISDSDLHLSNPDSDVNQENILSINEETNINSSSNPSSTDDIIQTSNGENVFNKSFDKFSETISPTSTHTFTSSSSTTKDNNDEFEEKKSSSLCSSFPSADEHNKEEKQIEDLEKTNIHIDKKEINNDHSCEIENKPDSKLSVSMLIKSFNAKTSSTTDVKIPSKRYSYNESLKSRNSYISDEQNSTNNEEEDKINMSNASLNNQINESLVINTVNDDEQVNSTIDEDHPSNYTKNEKKEIILPKLDSNISKKNNDNEETYMTWRVKKRQNDK